MHSMHLVPTVSISFMDQIFKLPKDIIVGKLMKEKKKEKDRKNTNYKVGA